MRKNLVSRDSAQTASSVADRALVRCVLQVAVVSIWVHCIILKVQGAKPVAVAENLQWNLAHSPILGIGPGGLRPSVLFQNSQNCTFTSTTTPYN